MAISTPTSWRDLTYVEVDLGDILGVPGLDVEESAERASGAFEVPVEQVGPNGGLQLMAQRRIVEPVHAMAEVPLADEALAADVLPASAVADPPDRRKVHVLESATRAHVVVQQQVRGCDVVGGRFLVHYDSVGAYGLTGHPVGDLADRDPGPPPGKVAARLARTAIRDRYNLSAVPSLSHRCSPRS